MAASAILILAIVLFVVVAVIAVAAVAVSVVTAVRDSSKLFSIVIASPWTVVDYPPS